MSRAYRIRQKVRVREQMDHEVSSSDDICSQLEIIEVLPPEDMGKLLAAELAKRGFESQDDGTMVRTREGVTATVDPQTGAVNVRVETREKVRLEGAKEDTITTVPGGDVRGVEGQLRQQLREEMSKQADEQHQRQVTGKLEQAAAELGRELDDAVNRATAEALKQKAAQMGQIKDISENPEEGSLTIKVEV